MPVDDIEVDRLSQLIMDLLQDEAPDAPEAITALGVVIDGVISKNWNNPKDREKVVELFTKTLRDSIRVKNGGR